MRESRKTNKDLSISATCTGNDYHGIKYYDPNDE